MPKRFPQPTALVVLMLFLAGCTSVPLVPARTPSALDPAGPVAAHLATLWWVMFALGTAMFLLVVGFMFAALLRRPRATSDVDPDTTGGDEGRRWPIWGGIILPIVVLVLTFGYNIYTLAAIEKPLNKTDVNIEIVGRRWWWEVKYPDQGITTANEIHIPVGVPVRVQLQSADVIHSFWVPELAGKMDLIPTRTNFMVLQADKPGVYRGQCAEFCGLQHAHMALLVIAEPEARYEAWLRNEADTARAPTTPQPGFGSRGASQRASRQIMWSRCAPSQTSPALRRRREPGQAR